MNAKLYVVKTAKPITGMGGIQGPLTTPSKINFSDVLDMVTRGYEIYEVNPYNHAEKVKVNITNINTISFKYSRSSAVSQRKLNREIQEMSKPMMVDTVVKEPKKHTKKVAETNEVEFEKISAPDAFTK